MISYCTSQKKPNVTYSTLRTSITVALKSDIKSTSENIGRKWVGRWLFGCSGMVFGAVVLGNELFNKLFSFVHRYIEST